jgi:hypothetical protein
MSRNTEQTERAARVLNKYFDQDDARILLTYKDQKRRSGQDMEELVRRLRRICKRRRIHFDYMWVTHWGIRTHFHLVISKEAAPLVAPLWGEISGGGLTNTNKVGENTTALVEWLGSNMRPCDEFRTGGLAHDRV